MTKPRRWPIGIGIGLITMAMVVVGLGGLRRARAESGDDLEPPQVTVFAILAKPGSKVVDSRLTRIQSQLNRLLPHHGFKLLDAQSKRLRAGESVVCDLGHGYTAVTALVQPDDQPAGWPHFEDPDLLGAVVGPLAVHWEKPQGKVQFRCELFLNKALQFSAKVKVPLNQLFFCERPFLDDGTKLLIGVGAR
ncbi:MAG TPA: hypothetical protein VFF52_09760 [Isosphaeraceae bacterium]|nr:hypothetical protein [Isosphaeraceae bacterium]